LSFTNWFTGEPVEEAAYVLNYDAAGFAWYTTSSILPGEPGISAIVEVPPSARLAIPLESITVVDTPVPSRQSFAGDEDDLPAHWDGLQLIPHSDENG